MKKRKTLATILIFAIVLTSVLSFGQIGAFADTAVKVTDSAGVIQIDNDNDGKDTVYDIMNGTGTRGDVTTALTKAFAYTTKYATSDNPLIISVPEGTYDVTKNIVLSSNTTLNIDKVTLYNTRTGKGNIFISPNSDNTKDDTGKGVEYYGFGSMENFTMNGGVLDYDAGNRFGSCLMRLAHCSNVSINGTSFMNNYYSHHIEIAACKDVTFDGCTFEGQTSDYSTSSSEALQIDILEESTHFSNFPYYDGTMSNGVTVQNCTFKNLVAGVGTRSAFAGMYQESVVIKNNTFDNITTSAIVCTNYTNTTITGNTITNSCEGISYYMDKQTGELCYFNNPTTGQLVCIRNTDCKSVIKNNSISTTKGSSYSSCPTRAIYVYGAPNNDATDYPTGNYAPYNLKIENNTITSSGQGIDAYDMQNSSVTGNAVTCTNSSSSAYGINLSGSASGNTVSSNTISGFKYAVCMQGSSTSNAVSSNNISSSVNDGIAVFNKSNNNVVSANTITSVGDVGIYAKASTGLTIDSNSVSSSKGYGVELVSSAQANITSNNIVSSKKSGITLLSSSTAPTLAGNTITGVSGNGIYLNSSSATTLTSNTISSCTQQGINISTSSNAYNVSANSVSATGQNGIRVYSSSAYTVSNNSVKQTGTNALMLEKNASVTYANGNSITSAMADGIKVYNGSKVTQLKSNSISNSNSNGISVSTNSTATIKSNNISSSGTNGIYVTNVSTGNASSNTVKSSGNVGIYISNKAISTLKSNKISSSASHGIYVGSNKATVQSNSLTSNGKYGAYFNKGATVTYKNNTYKSNKSGTAYSKGTKKSYKFSNITKPSSLKTSKSGKNVTVSWKKVSGATSYYVYRATSKSGTYKKIATVKSSRRSYVDKSSKSKGKTYYYKVVTVKKMNKVTAVSNMSSYKSKKI